MLIVRGLSQQFYLHGKPKILFSDLSFDVAKGERVAILGRNGQGKSTLIKILGGVLAPTSGQVTWNMTASWPIGFSGAFQGGLTGRDNILFVSRIYRKPPGDIIAQTERFAQLGPALTQPVKYYSTGMRARLAFGLSLAIDFDCYLIDEVIAVGDAAFSQKSQDELFSKRRNKAYLIATHDFSFVKAQCDRAIVIENGQATLFDDIDAATAAAAGFATHEPAA